MDKNAFYEKIDHYLHLNYNERMANNEEMFKSARSKNELKKLFNLFLECGVHSYEERLLIRIMGVADSNDDWEFLKFHGRYYENIYKSAVKALELQKESVSWLFFFNILYHILMEFYPKKSVTYLLLQITILYPRIASNNFFQKNIILNITKALRPSSQTYFNP